MELARTEMFPLDHEANGEMFRIVLSADASVPVISVIVPVRNNAHELRKCLEHLQSSTFPHFEVIVVDDGSTDDTAAVATALALVVSRENCQGPALAGTAAPSLPEASICSFSIPMSACTRKRSRN